MGQLDRVKSRAGQLRAVARILPHLRRTLPGTHWSAARLLAERARASPSGLAIRFADQRYTWAEVEEEALKRARALRALGIGPGRRVALLLDSSPEYLFLLMGVSRLGAVAALLNTGSTGPALVHALRISEAELLVTDVAHAAGLTDVVGQLEGLSPERVLVHGQPGDEPLGRFESLESAVKEAEGAAAPELTRAGRHDPMCLIYTSGTTGLPKAAVIKNSRFVQAGAFFGAGVMELGPSDVVYVPLPLYHSNGIFAGWSAALATGAAVALCGRFSVSRFWADIRKYEASVFLYIGELCRYLLNAPSAPHEAEHGLRLAVGNGLRSDVWKSFQERFGVPLIREFYGATEGNVILVNLEGRPGMVGQLTGNQIIVACDAETGARLHEPGGFCREVDEGETGLLLGRITNVTPYDGYLDAAASQKKIARHVLRRGDAYFDTGDLMTLHADGWVSFADRLGDTYRWNGENVSTTEVAEVLNRGPGVTESTVYGVLVPNREGRAGMAALTCGPDFSIERFADFVNDRLPRFQRPLFVRLLEEMAVTGTFKQKKSRYRTEGYDPAVVADPLFVREGQAYSRLDGERHDAITRGTLELR